ncbi:MAG TPA: chromosome partitioning protein ParB [Flavobacteriales bacterium]|nr:chromosome partitioning protein ParB [Flavobacteriales bacterium]
MNKKRNALGRGLSAILRNPQADITNSENSASNKSVSNTSEILIENIQINPFQPRKEFNKENLYQLSESIRNLGIIQPITVRKLGYDKFQLISGERRFRASQLAGLTEIPAYIRKADDQTMLEMALVENIQREDLDAIEVAISYQRLIEECKLTQESLSDKIGKNRSTVTNYLRLLKLPAEIQIGIIEKEISMGHARALVSITDGGFQLELFKRAIKEGLSVRQVEQLAKGNKSNSSQNNQPTLSFELQKKSDKLKSVFGSDTSLKLKDSGHGKIEIPFKSEAQLQEILDLLNL